MPTSSIAPISEIIADIAAGKMVILTDDENRENEGDIIVAADKVTPQQINFMVREGGGMLCLCLSGEICDRLHLHPQSPVNTTEHQTAYTVTIDAAEKFGVGTGVSAHDRCATIKRCIQNEALPADFRRPGHIAPLRARDQGVLVRAGHTEGTVDLARLAGLMPAGVLIEILNEDGTIARMPQLVEFAHKHKLKIGTIADLIEYRLQREKIVRRDVEINLPTRWGDFRCIAYVSPTEHEPHLALVKGALGLPDASGKVPLVEHPVLVRVHSECITGDVFGSLRCDCGGQLADAMQIIEREGEGVVVYLRQEGRGIGLFHKLHAYKLQEQGLDTVEANEELGFPADKRDYGVGAQILRDLGLTQIRILTNNPKKVSRLEWYGLKVTEQLPIEVPPTPHSARYLATKREKMGHKLKGV